MGAGLMGSDVPKSLVCGNEKSSLILDCNPKRFVLPAFHALIPHRRCIVASRDKHLCYRCWKILVDLNAH